MFKTRIAVATVVASGLIAVPAMTLAASAGTPKASIDPLLTVCATVTPKQLTVTVDGHTLLAGGTSGVRTQCNSI